MGSSHVLQWSVRKGTSVEPTAVPEVSLPRAMEETCPARVHSSRGLCSAQRVQMPSSDLANVKHAPRPRQSERELCANAHSHLEM